ncbi:MAG: MotA/TolQ/ExbB proton channel family protein [Bacillus sp. (in: Bacteria)]|nr:MotA/TolQ/ExbB proton channel family protein [Bacillus sp. (in: firmicutes)]
MKKKQQESVKVETFVQKKFSSWRVVNIPVISLIKMIQTSGTVLILVGVLGTFIGLAMSLGTIDATGDQLVENVAGVLAGLDAAFFTSIAGMGLSLIMTMATKFANTEFMLTDIMLKMESYLEETEPDAMTRLIDVSKSIHGSIDELKVTNQTSLQNLEKAFEGFQEYTVGLQQSAKDLATFNEGLSANLKDFQLLFTNVKKVTDGLDGSVKKLNNNFDQLFAYFKKMDNRNERMTNAFQDTYKKIEELTGSQIETLTNFQEAVEEWREYINGISDRQEAIHGSFERMIAQSDNIVKIMKKTTNSSEESLVMI